MPDGDSTDYDSLPSPPLRLSSNTSSRGGKATRRYGRKAARVLPRSPPPGKGKKGGDARGGRARAGEVKGLERSGLSEREGRGQGKKEIKGNQDAQKMDRSQTKVEELEEEADGESGAEEEERTGRREWVKGGKQRKRPPADSVSRDPSPPPAQIPFLALDIPNPSNTRMHKRPRVAPLQPPTAGQTAFAAPPTPPPLRGQHKMHPAVLKTRARVDHWSNMTPRSRARALGDKSNRPSLSGSGGTRPSQPRPSLPRVPRTGAVVDSPRSSNTQSKRGSLAPLAPSFGVFRDPAPQSTFSSGRASPAYPSLPPPTLREPPDRRHPLPRAATAASSSFVHRSLSAPSPAQLSLALPRSPGLSSQTQSRLPRASRALALPRSAPTSCSIAHPSALLTVPGAPPAGQAPRLPAPWSLTAPSSAPTSPPAALAISAAGEGGEGGEGGQGEQPIFRFTTTQFADLPSLSFTSSHPRSVGPDKGHNTGGGGRADESVLVGMDSSFMLETLEEGDGGFGEEGRWGDESITLEEEAMEETLRKSADETTFQVVAEVVEAAGEAVRQETRGRLAPQSGADEMAVDEVDAADAAGADGSGKEQPGLVVEYLKADDSLAIDPSPCSSPSSPASESAPKMVDRLPSAAYSANFMPPRRPRPPQLSPSLLTGPASDEDDLAYYLRITGTFSSEDDLPPSPSSTLSSSAEEDRLAEREVGRAVKPMSGQRVKRIEASAEARRKREVRKALRGMKGLRIGEGKNGRRKGWRRVVLSPPTRRMRIVRAGGGEEGYEADQGEVEGEGDEEDELAMVLG
ncbi:hypothetical protein JCM11251_004751 [Rhodosporidiobolus azoricus]